MICYQCGCEAGREEFCPECGADLRLFQKAVRISNMYYNDGLQKANVRNLSGAIISLKRSLKFYKYNIDARNLLGLVYYEVGEITDALSEWVISKSYQIRDNRAGYYLDSIQRNRGMLEDTNQTIKKYNKALSYCQQGSRDLAIIQIRKVLALNPKFVKGYQLQALLYMEDGKPDLAKKALRNAGKIDTDNTLTLRYLREVNARLRETAGGKKKNKPEDDLISYQSGNETIIMPKRFRESSLGLSLLYLIIGLAVGTAVTAWLIVPNVKKLAMEDTKQQLLEANDTITTNSQMITYLNEQIADLQSQLGTSEDVSAETEEKVTAYEKLLSAYDAYTQDKDAVQTGTALDQISVSYLSSEAKEIYDAIFAEISEAYLKQLYADGYAAYVDEDFEKAVTNLKLVTDREADYEEGKAVYYLAQSYRKLEDSESAKTYFQYIIDHYPDSEYAETAKNYVDSE